MRNETDSLQAPKRMEHRWGQRVPFDCDVRLLLQDGTSVEGQIRNASISGALIDTVAGLPSYTTLSVVLLSGQGSRRRTIELPACVVRISRGCIGVEWRDMAVPTLLALLREAGGPAACEIARDHAFG
jgi:PilZ domain